GVFTPGAARIVSLELRDAVEGVSAPSEFVLRVCLPIERLIDVRASGFYHLRIRVQCLLPVAVIDRFLARRVGLFDTISAFLRKKAGDRTGSQIVSLCARNGGERENEYERYEDVFHHFVNCLLCSQISCVLNHYR